MRGRKSERMVGWNYGNVEIKTKQTTLCNRKEKEDLG